MQVLSALLRVLLCCFDFFIGRLAPFTTLFAVNSSIALWIFGCLFGCPVVAGNVFVPIEFPGAVWTFSYGINDVGQVVGEHSLPASSSEGFIFANGTYNPFPAAIPHGINNGGQIVGGINVVEPCNGDGGVGVGFFYSNGVLTDILPYPCSGGSYQTPSVATAINAAGQLVGMATSYDSPGFLYSGGVFTYLAPPDAVLNVASQTGVYLSGINDSGQIVGSYSDNVTHRRHGLLYSAGVYARIDFPSAGSTTAYGINNNQQIVGSYYDSTGTHGFIFSQGRYASVDHPSGVGHTELYGINNLGQVVGVYFDAANQPHGFLLTSLNPKNLGPPDFCPIGNPINQATGNKYQIESDYLGAGPFSLVFQRYYNADSQVKAAYLGSSWRGAYDRSISVLSTTATVYRPDGKSFYFQLSAGVWVGDADVPDRLQQTPTGWTYTTADDSVETYDSTGRLLSIANRAGLQQTLTYSDGTTGANGGFVLDATGTATTATLPANLLLRVTDASNRSLSFGYDSASRIVKMLDPAGGNYLYHYDPNNNLSSVTYPDGKTKTYLYGETAYTSGASLPHALTGIIDENGIRYATYRYDATGRAYDEDHGGAVDHYNLAYTTDTSGNPVSTTVTDPLGTARTYNFTTVLGVVKSTGVGQPGGSGCGAASSGVTYDANGNVATRTDFNGNVTTYSYDLSRNLETSRTEASGTPLARTITTAWHPTYRLPTQITEPGRVTNFAYDSTTGNLLTKSITDSASATTRTWTYTYTTAADGTLPALLKTVDGPRTDVADVASYAYNPNGDLASVTNALGQVTTITTYDANGRPLTIVDPNGLTTTLAYTPRGWLASRAVGSETTRYTYDGVGQLTQVSLPDSSTITYTYDAAHRLTDITDTLNNHIHYTLDNIGNRTQENTYDSLNNLSTTKSRSFDALNRLWKEIGALNQTTLYTYDPNGNLISITDPLAHTTVNTYDALNRLTQVSDAASGITRYGYDPLDQLKSVTDPRGLITGYIVNALGDQIQLTSPDTGSTNKTYDASGNLKASTDARGVVSTYTYDALNRVTQIAYPGGLNIGFQYDQGPNAIGRVTAMTDPSGATTWTYNTQGRVASKTQIVNGVTQTLRYGYDSAGRPASLIYPSGSVVSYGYNTQGQIAAVAIGGVPVVSAIQYQPFGPVKGWTWGNGAHFSRSFDSDGRIASYALGNNSRTLSFDAASRISGYTDTQPAANQVFVYDTLDRLTSWIAPNTNRSYGYDSDGNRTSLTIGATQSAYVYPASSNQLSAITGGSSDNFAYDASGNLQYQYNRKFTYDARGRLIYVATNSLGVSFAINGLGQRVNKNGMANTLFAYDAAGHLIGEYDKTGQAIEETVYLGDSPVVVIKAGQNYYVYADHLNTPRVITNTANTPVWRWDSDPFGTDVPNQDPSGVGTFSYNLRFPGQYADQETGLNYNMARDYSPEIGGYIQSDPLGLFGGSLSTYAYVGGNPLSRIDPLGLRDVIVAIWTTRIAGYFYGDGSVGHVYVGELNGSTLLSQFPTPHAPKGKNTTLTWWDTVSKEGRYPDYAYQVTVPNDSAFDTAVSAFTAIPTWDFWPNGSTSTQCANAAANALRAGGVKGLSVSNPELPNYLNTELLLQSYFTSNVFHLPAVPW